MNEMYLICHVCPGIQFNIFRIIFRDDHFFLPFGLLNKSFDSEVRRSRIEGHVISVGHFNPDNVRTNKILNKETMNTNLESPVTKAYGVAVTCSKTTFLALAISGRFRNLDTMLVFFIL